MPAEPSRIGNATLYQGDVREVLPLLAANSVHCVVTSPPYFALRSYLPKDHPDKLKEMGSEPSPQAYIEAMVGVFREVRRVLREDGLLFLNIGDKRGRGIRAKWKGDAGRRSGSLHADVIGEGDYGQDAVSLDDDGQPLRVPSLLLDALCVDGWFYSHEIIWAKRSPMPESVKGWRWEKHRIKVTPAVRPHAGIDEPNSRYGTLPQRDGSYCLGVEPSRYKDCPGCPKCASNGGCILRRGKGRCTTAHEYVFVLAKTDGYFWDSFASREPATSTSGGACVGKVGSDGPGARRLSDEENAAIRSGDRNPRSVWWLSSEPTSLPHYATFPSELVRRCLVAGVGSGQCCPVCQAPFAPVVEDASGGTIGHSWHDHIEDAVVGQRACAEAKGQGYLPGRISAYRSTCPCGRPGVIPCTVLDPFCGTGRAGKVALQMGCRFIGIELNPDYIDFSRQTLAAVSMEKLDILDEDPADAPLLAGIQEAKDGP